MDRGSVKADRWGRGQRWRLGVLDLLMIAASWIVVLYLSNITIVDARANWISLVLVGITVVATMGAMYRKGIYQTEPALPRTEEISRLVASVSIGAASAIFVGLAAHWRIGAWEVVLGFLLTCTVIVIVRGFVRELRRIIPGPVKSPRVAVVGTGNEAAEIVEVIRDHPESQFELVGVIGSRPVAEEFGISSLWLGPTSDLLSVLRDNGVSSVIVTPTGFRGPQFRTICQALFSGGFDVMLSTGVSRLWSGRFEVRSLAHEPLVVMESRTPKKLSLRIKRLMDVTIGTLVLIVCSPVLAAAAIAIKLESKGPVLFRQTRSAHPDGEFELYKLRSMVVDAEELKEALKSQNQRSGPLFKLGADPRITRVGKILRELSIDELPQLLNVIKGDMSLVGPRPALIEETREFDEELLGRFRVRPGLSGLWQVEARQNSSFNAYRRLDLHYVENWTLGLDLRILLATAEQIFVRLLMAPIGVFVGGATDGVNTADLDDGTVIDLRTHANRTGGGPLDGSDDKSGLAADA